LPVNSSQIKIYPYDENWSASQAETYGAAIALKQENETDKWHTRLMVETSAHWLLEVKFTVRIAQSQDFLWQVEIQVKCEGGEARNILRVSSLKTSISRDYDLILDGKNGPTLVRPVLVPFSAFLR
jgi:hypothetical protein